MTAIACPDTLWCPCGEVLEADANVLQVYADGILHRPTECFPCDDLAAFTLCACGDPLDHPGACP